MNRILILVVFICGSAFCDESTTSIIEIFTINATTPTTPSTVKNISTVAVRTETTTTKTVNKNDRTTIGPTKNTLFSANETTKTVPNNCGTNNTNQTDCISVSGTTSLPELSKKSTNVTATTAKPKHHDNKGKIVKKNDENSKEVCSCDLQMNTCDLNCCCDHDCSGNHKKVFRYCQTDENRYYDSRYCDYMDYIYVNNTPFEWQVNQNGLFCIVKSNLPPSSVIQRKQPLKSYKEVEYEKTADTFSWKTESFQNDDSFNISQTFLYGNPVWMITENGDISKLRLPKNFWTSPCIFEENILLFKNTVHECSQVNISEENRKISFENYFQHFKIISTPIFFNMSNFKKDPFKECPKNVCLSIEANICEDFFKNCTKISTNNTQKKFACNFDLLHNKHVCQNAVKKLKYQFYHDGTKGFKKVEVLVVLQNFSYEFVKNDYEFFQEFSVNFLWVNQTNNISQVFSGNPGYIIKKSILIATKHNNIVSNTNIILRNSTKMVDNFLSLPKNVNGKKCVLNEAEYLLVDFGYNSYGKCEFVEQVFFNKSLNISANQICRNLQIKIFNLWSIKTNKTLVVGSFGNSNPKNLNDWVDVLFRVTPEMFLNNYTTGIFSKDNKTLNCFNITTSLSVDVFHSRVDFGHLLNQEKVLGVAFTFENIRNFSFTVNNEPLKNLSFFDAMFKMQYTVVFHDLTTEKSRKFVDPPSFEIKLPYDFFYPFVKVDNGVPLMQTVHGFVILTCLMLVSLIV